ncbi:MAG: hypothetical protein KGM16_01695 [Bacteroidota bacterium]|nr:hypothetical protein [Bacteroidota bacterium]
MSTQNLKNHTRINPLYHFGLYITLLICLAFSIWGFVRAYHHHSGRIVAATLVALTVAVTLTAYFTRSFSLVVQDRSIRAEENLRYFVLTGKLLDSRLTINQIIALRFAEDAEFIQLAEKAAKENLSPAAIKKEIVNWKADEYRV